MDRFLDEKNIVKKNNNISLPTNAQHILQKAQILRNNVQQKLDTLSPEQKEMLINSNDNIDTKNLMQNMIQTINTIPNSSIIQETNIINESQNQSSINIQQNNSYIKDTLDQANSILQEKDNIIQHKKRNINEGLLEDENTTQYITDMHTLNHENNNQNNIQINNTENIIQQAISPVTDKSNIIQNKQVLSSEKNIINNNLNQSKMQISNSMYNDKNQRSIRMTSKDLLLQKKEEAYNKLLDYQVEYEICSKMAIIVEDKLKTSYKTKLKDLQSKMTEQEQRISVIANLLKGK